MSGADAHAASGPSVRVFREPGPLHPHDAEPLPGRGLHDNPALQPLDDFGTELLQSGDLGRGIICLDVQVDPTVMTDALNLHDKLVRRRLQHPVIPAATRMFGIYRAA